MVGSFFQQLQALLRPMSPDALRQQLLKLRLGFSAADLQDAVNLLPMKGDLVDVNSLEAAWVFFEFFFFFLRKPLIS